MGRKESMITGLYEAAVYGKEAAVYEHEASPHALLTKVSKWYGGSKRAE